ncbi:MAG: argininosuccinate lyase [Thermaerobacter sp.]|jgi:argininosuccinate lyase|nr:argininosuccinate lyase [Thermaerobacter sp.]
MSDKPWGGRFREGADTRAEAFTSSLDFDRRLWSQDLAGSRAHVRMLTAQGILTAAEGETLLAGLDQVAQELTEGTFPFRREYEDIHLNIERRLIEQVGPVGGKLHTARSRNDQVALDLHLFAKEAAQQTLQRVRQLQRVLVAQAEARPELIVPGYTHLQRAQPVLFAHHLLAYFFMLERDRGRFRQALIGADCSPLGAGALAGTPFPIDRRRVAAELGLSQIYANSMDAVSDRDFVLDYLAAAAVLMVHLSRLAEELVLWSSTEFGFLELPDRLCTGSSIMPQKKNPDTAELIRGKAGRCFGNLQALLTTLKGLPLTYCSDLQEDKECFFDTCDTVSACLEVAAALVEGMRPREERLAAAVRADFSTATDLADYLARRGMPFREAHAVAGRLVLKCLEQGRLLTDLSLEELQAASELFAADSLEVLQPAASVAARRSEGGTAPERVAEELELARRLLD